jgi:hypothetical protein
VDASASAKTISQRTRRSLVDSAFK